MERTIEQRYADLLRGGTDNSPLAAPGYKFSMAQAGYPLRRESFYLHYRRGGALFIPFDFKKVIEELRPRLPDSREQGFLLANGYGFTPAMEAALRGELKVGAQKKGTWANEHEPVAVPRGPSFLVSWFEDLIIAFHYPMQIATAILDGVTKFTATCEDEKEIILLVNESLGEPHGGLNVTVDEASYRKHLREKLRFLNVALDGDIHRAFEVGTRSMACMAQHRIVLEECKAAGINRTANVKLAYDLYMIPVGTTGHEHQMRHGADIDGFRAVRDQRPEPPSYLFDTYDPEKVGIPAAIQAMLEDRVRNCSVRFDSGDQCKQLRMFRAAEQEHGIHPFYLFMDGYDDERVAEMESLIKELQVDPKQQGYVWGLAQKDCHYGMGSYFVDTEDAVFTRSRVAMVYKLTTTGGPGYDGEMGRRNVLKYSGSPGKESLPGLLFVLVAYNGDRYICQEGEGFKPPSGFRRDGGTNIQRPTNPSILSPATLALIEQCRVRDFGGTN